MPLSLLTPTGGRPEAFNLLERWIAQQTYKGPIDWVVVDDCRPMTFCNQGQRLVRPTWSWTPGCAPTLAANLALGLSLCRYDKILFIEDDECYLPHYLESMDEALDRSCIAGQTPARYYNVFHRAYRIIPSTMHASLCQTGIRSEMVPLFLSILNNPAVKTPFVDIPLWLQGRSQPGFVDGLVQRMDVVSIKGMPGRPGIGAGHRAPSGHWVLDPDLEWLSDQITPRRAACYEMYAAHTIREGRTAAAM